MDQISSFINAYNLQRAVNKVVYRVRSESEGLLKYCGGKWYQEKGLKRFWEPQSITEIVKSRFSILLSTFRIPLRVLELQL